MYKIEIATNEQIISEEDKQSVIQLATELDRCWNERNATEYADLFTPDADFRFDNGIWIDSKEAIENFWRDQVFAGSPASFRHVSTIQRVRFIAANVVIGDGTILIVDMIDGRERVHFEEEVTAVGVKKDGRWYFSAVRLAVMSPE